MGHSVLQAGQSDHLQHLSGSAGAPGPIQSERDVTGHAEMRKQCVVLEDHPHLAAFGGNEYAGAVHRLAVDPDGSRVRQFESGQNSQGRGLARCRWSQHGQEPSALGLQGEVIQGDGARKALVQSPGREGAMVSG